MTVNLNAQLEFAKQVLSSEGWEVVENKTGFHLKLKESDVDYINYRIWSGFVFRVYQFALAYIDCYKRGLIKVSNELMEIINGIDC